LCYNIIRGEEYEKETTIIRLLHFVGATRIFSLCGAGYSLVLCGKTRTRPWLYTDGYHYAFYTVANYGVRNHQETGYLRAISNENS
jgi:hypothetical protein